jgi:hypothetical protein
MVSSDSNASRYVQGLSHDVRGLAATRDELGFNEDVPRMSRQNLEVGSQTCLRCLQEPHRVECS